MKNTQGKLLFMSARHCFDFQAHTWCTEGGSVHNTKGVRLGSCTRIVAASPTLDDMMFEIAPTPEYASTPLSPLRLARTLPRVGQRLNMLGFPADSFRQGTPSITRNCWVLESNSLSRRDFVIAEARKNGIDPNRPINRAWADYLANESNARDPRFKHNCTVYGGNSGGPIVREGTDVAVGLPNTYFPRSQQARGLLRQNDLSTAAHGSRIDEWVKTFADVVAREGIVLAD